MGKRYVSNVLMTTAVLLRSGMKRNFHVPFWRAVEGATLSLTLIIRDEVLRILSVGSIDTAHGGRVKPVRLVEKVSSNEVRIP